MKKYVSVMFFCACVTCMDVFGVTLTEVYPFYATRSCITNYAEGPVKQITIIKNLENVKDKIYDVNIIKKTYLYDIRGRLKKRECYFDDILQNGYARLYIKNICIEQEYNSEGIIEGNYKLIRIDSMGRQIASIHYDNSRFFSSDSTVYDESGRATEYYSTSNKRSKKFGLQYTYEYDSLGRFSKVRDFAYLGGEIFYHVEYHPNGNFTEHLTYKNGEDFCECIVNEQGLIVECKRNNGRHGIYSDFDKYGNWLQVQTVDSDTDIFVTKRIIEYYE